MADAETTLEATLLTAMGFGVIPAVEVDGVTEAYALAETPLEAGLDMIELTFRTYAAAEVVARIAQCFPDMVVVAAVEGTWIANRGMIRGGGWTGIYHAAKDAPRMARAARELA